MADKTGVEWTGSTWTPLVAYVEDPKGKYTFPDAPGIMWRRGWFCSHASEGCRNCYAEKMNLWRGNGLAYKAQLRPFVRFEFAGLDQPLRWRAPRPVFVCSMTDLFAEFYTDEQIDRVFAVMALAPRHTFQVLTKRAKRMREYLTADGRCRRILEATLSVASLGVIHASGHSPWPLPNVWLGVSVEDQKNADERVPHLLQTPAAVRWLSVEPLLGPVELRHYHGEVGGGCYSVWLDHLDWVVVGGESGPGARPFDISACRAIVAQCKAADVRVFVKQMGAVPVVPQDEWMTNGTFRLLSAKNKSKAPDGFVPLHMKDAKGGDPEEWPADLRVREFPEGRAAL